MAQPHHFTDENTEAWRGEVTCPSLHSLLTIEPRCWAMETKPRVFCNTASYLNLVVIILNSCTTLMLGIKIALIFIRCSTKYKCPFQVDAMPLNLSLYLHVFIKSLNLINIWQMPAMFGMLHWAHKRQSWLTPCFFTKRVTV